MRAPILFAALFLSGVATPAMAGEPPPPPPADTADKAADTPAPAPAPTKKVEPSPDPKKGEPDKSAVDKADKKAEKVGADGLTDAERKAIKDALGEDAATNKPAAPVAPPAPQVSTMGGSTAAAGANPGINAMNPAIALILDAALAYFSIDDPMQAGAHDPARTGFTFQQLEMYIESNVDPFFKLQANLVFSEFGVEVEEAFGTTLGLPAGLQFRVGQFLTRFGRTNNTHPHAWHFTDQPIGLGRFFGGESSRGLGVEASWLTPASWFLEVYASGQMPVGECCARSYFGGSQLKIEGPADFVYTVGVKQFFDIDLDWGLVWNVNAQFGPNASGNGNRTEIYGTDLYLRYRPVANTDQLSLSITAEFMLRARQLPGRSLVDYNVHSQAVLRIDRQWEIGARYEYLLGLEDDPLDPGESGDRHRVSIQGTFYPSHFSRLRLQGTYDDADWQREVSWGAIFAVEFLIGAHGAHHY